MLMKSLRIRYHKINQNRYVGATIKLEHNQEAFEAHAAGRGIVEAVTKAYTRALFSAPKTYWKHTFN